MCSASSLLGSHPVKSRKGSLRIKTRGTAGNLMALGFVVNKGENSVKKIPQNILRSIRIGVDEV